ncbi:transcriptional regulator with XRE-family HTH domain [Azospirillum lipoferum]|nr:MULTISPECIES: helix-turn-helix transcriptional regulator [Azospirillum]MCP1612145.1 transcriptional regulator with XRE-family HTH domain [Azospirillum lipoferum]MDW5536632.1 helix-turn-helix transcriptional regulator [Azospirillum sp. NL1]
MTDDLKRIVGLKIRAERLARGMTQEQLSEHINRTVETVSNLERGKAWPGLETLLQICSVLHVSFAQLFDEEGAVLPSRRRVELIARMKVLLNKLTDNDLEIAVRQVEALASGRQRD